MFKPLIKCKHQRGLFLKSVLGDLQRYVSFRYEAKVMLYIHMPIVFRFFQFFKTGTMKWFLFKNVQSQYPNEDLLMVSHLP